MEMSPALLSAVVLDESLAQRLQVLAHASELAIEIQGIQSQSAFLVVCTELAEVVAARTTECRYVVALQTVGLPAETAIAAGADRVVGEMDDAGWTLLLRECCGMWQRRRKQQNHHLALKAVLSHMSEAVEITSPDVCIEYVNPAFRDLTGFGPEDAVGKSPGQFLRNDLNNSEFFASMERTWRAGEVWTGELLGKHRDGHDTYSIATVIPVLGADGELAHGVAIKQGVILSGQEHAEKGGGRAALSRTLASEARYRDMVNAAEDLILVADMETGQIIDANRAALAAFGYSLDEMRQCTSRSLAPASERKIMRRANADLVATGRARAQRIRLQRNDRSLFWGSVILQKYESGGRNCQLGVIRDVSDEVAREDELETAHQQVLHSARLAAIGRLAAGVAHEINNPATFVKSNIEVLLECEEGKRAPLCPEERIEALQDSLVGIGRIESVAHQLVAFARTPRVVMKQVCVNEVLDVALRMTANEIRHRASLFLQLSDGLPFVKIDENRLGQVLTNVLVNAAHAIEEGDDKKHAIHVSTELEGEEVVVRVRDTGHGMSESVRKRALEPFFTTKKPGAGTGLGLALCVDILAAQGGTLTIHSEEGIGTTVEIRLLCDEVPEAGQSCDAPRPAPVEKGKARVLFIDDEKLVLRVYRRWMRDAHEVVLAGGGREGLDVLAEDRNFDMIVCDVMMPNIDGPGVYGAIVENYPELARRVVFCTGGAFTERSANFLRSFEGIVLNKPVERDDVISALNTIRDTGGD